MSSSDNLLSVRKQIAIAKTFKAAQSAPQKSVVRTSFRKTQKSSRTARDAVDKAEAELPLGKFDLSSLPILLIDGYNVIGLWPRLKKRWRQNDMAGARDMLLADVMQFAARRYEPIVVFDANGAGAPDDRYDDYYGMQIVSPSSARNRTAALGPAHDGRARPTPPPASQLVRCGADASALTQVWAHDTADAFIERKARRLCLEGERQVWAATNDGAIQIAATTYGAHVMSANWLVSELKDSRAGGAAIIKEHNEREDMRYGRSTLWHALDTATQQQLEARFRPADPTAGLSRKNREAYLEAERLKQAGQLQQRRAAIPPPGASRRRRRAANDAAADDRDADANGGGARS